MSLLHDESFPAQRAGWILSYSLDQFSGRGSPGLNLRDVRRLPVPLAPLSEQDALATAIDQFLGSVTTLTECFREAYDSLDQLDQTILAKAFRGELVPQDPSDEPAAILLERLREEWQAAAIHNGKTKLKRDRRTVQKDRQ
jgi:type I restriction enzyme S subunit